MVLIKRRFVATLAVFTLVGTVFATPPAPVFTDTFSIQTNYSATAAANASNGNFIATDGTGSAGSNPQGTWSTGGGSIVYSRSQSDPPTTDNSYNYQSSVLLTAGSTPATGSTAGLAAFTVTTTITAVPDVNTGQPGVIISGALGDGPTSGSYLLEIDNGQNKDGRGSPFVLLAVTGAQLIGDEGTAEVIHNFGTPVPQHSYSVSVTEHRPSDPGGHTTFDVRIADLTADDATPFYSGTVTDSGNTGTFGGTQIGFRVRDPRDIETSSFGPLSLSIVAP